MIFLLGSIRVYYRDQKSVEINTGGDALLDFSARDARCGACQEPTLTRHGYTAKVLTEMLGTKPGEIKALFKQTLEVDRARELKEQMLAAGLPL